jgi:hypothetical protein
MLLAADADTGGVVDDRGEARGIVTLTAIRDAL